MVEVRGDSPATALAVLVQLFALSDYLTSQNISFLHIAYILITEILARKE